MEQVTLYEQIEKNLVGMLAEQQVKLGYLRETVNLYFPRETLGRLLRFHEDCGADELYTRFAGFAGWTSQRLGDVVLTNKGQSFCVTIPEKGGAYVHRLLQENRIPGISFLEDFLQVIGRHGVTIEELEQVFRRYSQKVCVEEIRNAEFDYMIYFPDGVPDDFRYCIQFLGEHAIYHRLAPTDAQY